MKFRLIAIVFMGMVFAVYSYFCLSMMPIQFDHPRYQKVTQSGGFLLPWQGPWACVMDKKTGLLWEVKTDDESIHDADWTYSWFNGKTGEPNKGDCFYQNGRCDTAAFVARTNHQHLCGLKNWRLPTPQELISLMEPNDRPNQAQIASDFFPRIHNSGYWTQINNQPLTLHFRHLKHGALSFNLFEGNVNALPYRNAAFVVLVTDQRLKERTSQMAITSIDLKNHE